ncbi:MAG: hypothetical protein QOJ51_1766 [Acidobacteriaceae bacterium]|jgi:hypothetical protein|nr:hypothetical protein [Acidobacteriaceae bacterium]
MLIKKADVKRHLAARRARHLQLLTPSPSWLGSEPMQANAHGSTLEPIRLVPRISIPPVVQSAPPAVQSVSPSAVPAHSHGTKTVFKPSEWWSLLHSS